MGCKQSRLEGVETCYGIKTEGDDGACSSDGGCSSNTSLRDHLIDIKNELESDTDFLQVAHIETGGQRIEEQYDGVHTGKILGEGAGGIVREVTHRKTGIKYAVKCLDLTKLDSMHNTREKEQVLSHLKEEITIMCQLDHPGIHRLEQVHETQNRLYLIQQLCRGGDLFDRAEGQPDYRFPEAECADLLKQMLSALRYLHSKNIIHRDLKLENFLFDFPDSTLNLKMIDFGYSKHFDHPGETIRGEKVGTPYTSAPEVLKGEYDEKADLWSIGVIAYTILSGYTPFGGLDGEDPTDVDSNIRDGRVTFEEHAWDEISEEGRAFVQKLLNTNKQQRPSASEALEDPWIKSYEPEATDTNGELVLTPQTYQGLKEYKCYSKLRRVLSEALGFSLLPEQICALRREFEKIDKDRQGELVFSNLKRSLDIASSSSDEEETDDEDAEEIFNAMRIHKKDSKVRWHEFVAAELGQCNVNEKNLELAFEKVDQDGKGYIVRQDVKRLLGGETDESVSAIWGEEFSRDFHVTYHGFYDFMRAGLRMRGRNSTSILL